MLLVILLIVLLAILLVWGSLGLPYSRHPGVRRVKGRSRRAPIYVSKSGKSGEFLDRWFSLCIRCSKSMFFRSGTHLPLSCLPLGPFFLICLRKWRCLASWFFIVYSVLGTTFSRFWISHAWAKRQWKTCARDLFLNVFLLFCRSFGRVSRS